MTKIIIVHKLKYRDNKGILFNICGTWWGYPWGDKRKRATYTEDWGKVTCKLCIRTHKGVLKTYHYKKGW